MRSLIIGASGGIGAALTRYAARTGVEAVTLSRSQDGFDVTNPAAVAAQLQALDGTFDRVIVALGQLGDRPEKSLSAIEAEQMAQVFAVNAIGPALVLKDIARLLPRDRRAVVGVLSARVGSIGDNRLGGWHSYRASKAAVNQIIRGAAIELRRTRPMAICAALHPGTVATPFTASYPAHKKTTPDQAAAALWQVMDDLSPDQTGGFYDYSGAEIAW